MILILASGVSIAPAVMTWTATGIRIALDDYIDDSIYQMGVRVKSLNDPTALQALSEIEHVCERNPWIGNYTRILTTACLVDGHLNPTMQYSFNLDYFYGYGMKDASVILADNDMLEDWAPIFEWEGKFQINENQAIVSERFVETLYGVSGVLYGIGDLINIDIVLGAHGVYPDGMVGNRRYTMMNLTIVGIYKVVKAPTLLGDALHGLQRLMFDPYNEYTFYGLYDGIIVNVDRVSQEVKDEIKTRSFFRQSMMIQIDGNSLINSGEDKVGSNIRFLISRFNEEITVNAWGVQETDNLESYISVYLGSRLILALGLPTLLIAIFLAVNTSESSVTSRKGEMSLLRSKGASYNQILSGFMWESVLLSVIALFLGILLSTPLAAYIGSSSGFLQTDPESFDIFISKPFIPYLGLILAAGISLCLPMTYLIHVARLVEVGEVGRPLEDESADVEEETRGTGSYVGLLLSMMFIIVGPIILPTESVATVGAILFATLLLYAASYFGTQITRRGIGKIANDAGFTMGEKSLYLARSLQKRKGQHLPILILLTLILTSSTMLVVQYNNYTVHLSNEMEYSIGADVRIETDGSPLSINWTVYQVPGVKEITPLMKYYRIVATEPIYFIGIDAPAFSRIAYFKEDSFSSGAAKDVLEILDQQQNGIVISTYHANLWNMSVGDTLSIFADFIVVGLMDHLPGLGVAASSAYPENTLPQAMDTQVIGAGFAIVNLEYLMNVTHKSRANLFLVDLFPHANVSSTIRELNNRLPSAKVRSPLTRNFLFTGLRSRLYLQGLSGLLSITFVISTGMGIFAVLTMLSSSVDSRKNEYAILRAIGTTRDDITRLVLGEFLSIVLAVVFLSMALGIFFGGFLSSMAFNLSPYIPILNQSLSIPYSVLGVLLLIQGALMALACLVPARLANKTDPAIQLRNL